MEDDIAAAMEQMLRGGGGPDLEAFVSRCPESMMPFSREFAWKASYAASTIEVGPNNGMEQR